jgi:putative oxidoreductase
MFDYFTFRDYLFLFGLFILNDNVNTVPIAARPCRRRAEAKTVDPTPLPENTMIENRTAPYAALLLRLSLGTMFVAHALLKLTVFTLPGTAQFFQSMGLPGVLAYAVFAAELAGGLLLIAGVGTRWVSAALVPVLLGATWAHAGNGWLFSAPNGGWEYPAFLTAATVVQALLGNGAYALANLRAGRRPQLQAA